MSLKTACVRQDVFCAHTGQIGYVEAVSPEGIVLFFDKPADGFLLFGWEEIEQLDAEHLSRVLWAALAQGPE